MSRSNQGYYPPQQTYPQNQGYSAQHAAWNPEAIYAEANGRQPLQHSSLGRGNDYGVETDDHQPQTQAHQGNGERGIGATLVGGAGGAFLGHELGHNKLATIGGVLVGAIAANALEHHERKKHEERRLENAYDRGYDNGEQRELPGQRSRDLGETYSRNEYYQDDSSYRSESTFERDGYRGSRDYDYDETYGQDDYDYQRRDGRQYGGDYQNDYYSRDDRYYGHRDDY